MESIGDSLADSLAQHEHDHGSRLRDAAHLGVQSLGRAVDATDSIIQNAIFDVHVHGGQYPHLTEKGLNTTHTAMKYMTLGTSIADTAVKSDGKFFQTLFHDPNALPDMLMPMIQHPPRQY
jgi:hypothetical protein